MIWIQPSSVQFSLPFCCVRLTTSSGLLLHPSRPATATDVQMLQVWFVCQILWHYPKIYFGFDEAWCGRCIVKPPIMVSVTTLPCKILVTTLFVFTLFMFIMLNFCSFNTLVSMRLGVDDV